MTRKNTVRERFENYVKRIWPEGFQPLMRTADGRYALSCIESEWRAFHAGSESTRRRK